MKLPLAIKLLFMMVAVLSVAYFFWVIGQVTIVGLWLKDAQASPPAPNYSTKPIFDAISVVFTIATVLLAGMTIRHFFHKIIK